MAATDTTDLFLPMGGDFELAVGELITSPYIAATYLGFACAELAAIFSQQLKRGEDNPPLRSHLFDGDLRTSLEVATTFVKFRARKEVQQCNCSFLAVSKFSFEPERSHLRWFDQGSAHLTAIAICERLIYAAHKAISGMWATMSQLPIISLDDMRYLCDEMRIELAAADKWYRDNVEKA